MTKILLSSYRKEYETTSISLQDLCDKYSIEPDDLKGHTSWRKVNTPLVIQPILEESNHKELDTKDSTPIGGHMNSILSTVEDIKLITIGKAKTYIEGYDAAYGNVKELKDMLTLVDTIERSYKEAKGKDGPTINILVQNLAERYKDDC